MDHQGEQGVGAVGQLHDFLFRQHGQEFEQVALTEANYREVLARHLTPGPGLVVNLSVEVSSIALIEACHELGALYLDTCIEPWPGGYTDASVPTSQRSNYALREQSLDLRRRLGKGPTAIVAHGANPGLVSHFVKRALLNVAADIGVAATKPVSREGWAKLASRIGLKGIHIAERDTQKGSIQKARGEFVNTWSIDGFISEGLQPAELGWGTHEKALPPEGRRHDFGSEAAIYLDRHAASTRVRTWTPNEGPFVGFLITHNEAISISDFFTLRRDGKAVYRPTCHYAYHPSDDAVLSVHELQGKNWEPQKIFRLLDETTITGGMDELGVLLYGHSRNAYWYGSQLDIHEKRRLAPYQNATGMQVTAAVLAGVVWAIRHPELGVLEADELDHDEILEVAEPYLGPMVGAYTDWTPIEGRGDLFPEDIDRDDPWQFRNVIVR
jgi:homospermidine synthase